jgi:hypothetical protein
MNYIIIIRINNYYNAVINRNLWRTPRFYFALQNTTFNGNILDVELEQ